MTQEYRADNVGPRPELPPSVVDGVHKYRWLFKAPPVTAPGGETAPFTVPETFADDLGKHLERNAFWSRAELIALADADGNLKPEALPGPTIRQDPPEEGPDVWINPGRWVPIGAPAPKRADDLTDEQAAALRQQMEAAQRLLDERDRKKKGEGS